MCWRAAADQLRFNFMTPDNVHNGTRLGSGATKDFHEDIVQILGRLYTDAKDVQIGPEEEDREWLALHLATQSSEIRELLAFVNGHYVLEGPAGEGPLWSKINAMRRDMFRISPALHPVVQQRRAVNMVDSEEETQLPTASLAAQTKMGLWKEISVLFDTGAGVCLLGAQAKDLIDMRQVTQTAKPLCMRTVFGAAEAIHYYTHVKMRVGKEPDTKVVEIKAYVAPAYAGGILLGVDELRRHCISLINDEQGTTVQFAKHGGAWSWIREPSRSG